MTTYALAPSPKWYFLDAQGRPAAGGSLTTWAAIDHSTPKFVFSDPAGTLPYTDPIILDATGGTPVPMYWDTTTAGLYYIVVKDASGNIIFDLDHFPISGSGGVTPITTAIDIENHVINGAFLFIDAPTTADSLISPAPAVPTRIAPASGFFKTPYGQYIPSYLGQLSGWQFTKEGGAGETSSIEFIDIALLGAGIPNNPSANATRYFRYTLTAPAAAQTKVMLYQTIPGVETFQNETLTVSFDIQASVGGVGSFIVQQFFGTGGSASVTSVPVAINFVNIPVGWSRVSFPATVPSTVGKTKGPSGDDNIQLQWHFPLNTAGSFDITNLQVQRGSFATPAYIYQDYNQDQYKVLIDLLQRGNVLFLTGMYMFTDRNIAPPGWLFIFSDTQSIGKTSATGADNVGIEYQNLYILWWDIFPQSRCVVGGGRGASALDDFNAPKPMSIPNETVGHAFNAFGLSPSFPFGATESGAGTGVSFPLVTTKYLIVKL